MVLLKVEFSEASIKAEHLAAKSPCFNATMTPATSLSAPRSIPHASAISMTSTPAFTADRSSPFFMDPAISKHSLSPFARFSFKSRANEFFSAEGKKTSPRVDFNSSYPSAPSHRRLDAVISVPRYVRDSSRSTFSPRLAAERAAKIPPKVPDYTTMSYSVLCPDKFWEDSSRALANEKFGLMAAPANVENASPIKVLLCMV